MIFKATTLLVCVLFLCVPLSVFLAAFAERKYLESKSGAHYAELKAFGVWVVSLIVILSVIVILLNLFAGYF